METKHDSPQEIRLTPGRDGLVMVWHSGQATRLDAATLRMNCPSAGAKRLRLYDLAVPPAAGLTIDAVHPVGHYAINIAFSDGHARGIYPWSLLQQLAGWHRDGANENDFGNSLTDAPAGDA